MSLPSLERSSVALLVGADFHAAKQEEQASSKSVWLAMCFRILTVKRLNSSVFNSDRKANERVSETERMNAVMDRACMCAGFFPLLCFRVWLSCDC